MTQEEALKLFDYNSETGVLRWKSTVKGKMCGKIAGRIGNHGYYVVVINYQMYMVTHIIWLIVYGKMPNGIVEHKDLNKTNNRIDNLRDTTHNNNAANVNARIKNNTGAKGVHFDNQRLKYKATIMHNYKTINIGRFDSLEEAKRAYDEKAKELFGEFARS